MPSIALYYPWMHFQDDNWLRLALLTWDHLARVRPRVVEDRDGELVRQLRAETDFIVETAPSPTVLDTVAESFGQIFDAAPGFLLERYGLTEPQAIPLGHGQVRLAGWRDYEPPVTQHVVTGPPLTELLTWVYVGGQGSRMGGGLRDSLVSIGLAIPSEGPWVGMDPKLGSIYLAALADAMARSEVLSPATDDPRMHNAVGALDRLTALVFNDHVSVPAVEDVERAYLHVALRTVIEPDNLNYVPTAKLIRFRETHRSELAAFHEHVAGMGAELQAIAKVESLEVASAHLRALYETRTRPQLNDLRRALRGLGVESSAGTLAQKIDFSPAAGTVLGSIAAAGGQLAVASAAVAVTLVPYLAGKFKARHQQVTNSPVAYLLAADRELTGRTLLGAFHHRTGRR